MGGLSWGVSRILGTWIACAIVGCAGTLVAAEEPQDIERQTREFKVSVDGIERGKCTMQIGRRDDGTDWVRIDSRIRINYVVSAYRFTSSGAELWKDGRLLELENSADYNGAKYLVKADAGKKGLQVTVNGRPSPNETEAWVTSYWHLPERLAEQVPPLPEGGTKGGRRAAARIDAQPVPLLDSNRGRALRGKLYSVGEESVNVAGKRAKCAHYRVSGDVKVDLWYDADRRLVRQESVDEGHDTVLELIRITAER